MRQKPPSRYLYVVCQQEWAWENKVEVGTLVRITRKAESYSYGWGNTWAGDRYVGGIYPVLEFGYESGVMLEGPQLWYPFFVLARPTQEELVLFALSDGLG